MAPLIIIDASGYLYASYHAIQNMTNSKGESTNALFGFINSVQKIMQAFTTPHVVVVFDGPNNIESRKAIYADYKAHRVDTPKDLSHQIAWAKEYCRLKGLPMDVVSGVEADDTMASIAVWAAEQGMEVLLCTSDKDMCQIVNDKIQLVHTRKDNKLVNVDGVEEIHGVPPKLIPDYLAIVGDSSDNIPGIPGFGPKTAAALLKEFGSLEAILANPDKVPGAKKQEAIKEHAENARIGKQLAIVNVNIPFEQHENFFHVGKQDTEGLIAFFKHVDFHSMIKNLITSEESTLVKPPEETSSYTLIEDEPLLDSLLAELSKQNEISFNTITTHEKPFCATLIGIGLGYAPGNAWYIPLNGKLDKSKILEKLKPFFENPKLSFYAHNAKYDAHILANEGIFIRNISFDTLVASYILNAHQRQHSLEALAMQNFGKALSSLPDLLGKGRNAIPIYHVPADKMCLYCCEEVDYTIRLKELLEKEIHKRGLEKVYFELELPLGRVLERMERKGIFLNVPLIQSFSQELTGQLKEMTDEIQQLAGEPFNLNSPSQLSQILTKLGIRTGKKTTSGMSTSADELEKIRHLHPLVDKMLEYRTLEKLRSTYVDTLPLEVAKDNRIHCNFNQSVAATGRLSSQDPNLQNIPVRTAQGLRIRETFKPEMDGWVFLSADYSQIELRLLAHLSEDPTLVNAFLNKEDIHRATAAGVLQVPIDQVTDHQRYQAKAVNFGILYGQQAYGLSQNLNISMKEADNFIHAYFERYPKVKEYIEASKEATRTQGKAVTLFGRERAIPEINNKNPMIRSAAERLAVNTPIQGTAADLIKLAMLEIDKLIIEKGMKSFMVLQIHDELIFEVPPEELESLQSLVKHTMENVMQLRVPLEVNIGIGKNWKEC